MKKIMFYATLVAMAFAMAMPVQAQSRKDKKAAKKAQWEMEQRQKAEEAELRHKLRMDSIANAKKVAEQQAAKAEAERRAKEAEEKARQQRAAEEAGLREVDLDEPCSNDDWQSTADMIRGRGVADDYDEQNSVDDARQAAVKELAGQISTKVQDLVSRNRKSAKKDNERATLQKVESMTVTEVEESTGFRKACCKTTRFVENGKRVYKTYYVVELPAASVLKNIYSKLQADEDLQLDMNFDEFKAEFDKRFSE